MRRPVLWNGTICLAKRVGLVGVFVALLCIVLVDLLEANRSIHKECAYGNGADLAAKFIEENVPTLYSLEDSEQNAIPIKECNLLFLNKKRSKSNNCGEEEWQENLSKSNDPDNYQTSFRKLHDHLQKRACPGASSDHGSPGSPSMVKRPPIRALLTSPEELENSYSRPSRKLADIGSIFSGGGQALLIGVIVTTMVLTLGLFASVLYCCLGRDALRPAKPNESQQEEEAEAEAEEDDLIVNIRSKDYKGKLGTLQRSMRVSVRDPKIKNLLDSVDESGTASLPLPPGKLSIFSPPASPPPPPPPPPPTGPQAAAPPPPPPPSGLKVPPPKAGSLPPPNKSGNPRHTTIKEENNTDEDSGPTQTKLKPFFWDKVNAIQGRSMVWHHLKDGSFQLDEETMVGLFGYVAAQNKKERGKIDSCFQSQTKLIQIIDSKKSQNLAILLRALNVTTEQVCEAVQKGTQLPVELISTLLKMTPTQDEELKLRLYNGDLNQLGTSERFLKNLVEIPFAFKRLEALLFMGTLHENYHVAKESFATLEVACNKLTSSRLFLRLLEAVLKTGNRMNDGTYRGGAQAFKLDTLLKLSDVKGTDGKTTLLSFVVQEIIRYEGIKVARNRGLEPNDESPEYLKQLGMDVVAKLSEELNDVKKASIIDGEMLTSTVSKLGNMLKKTKEFMTEDMKKAESATEFNTALTRFLEYAEADIKWMIEEEKRIMAVVKSTADYFHGKSGKDEGLRLFAIVRDFLKILDNTCNEVRKTLAIQKRLNQKESTPTKTNKQYWKNTRDKIMIMKDAVRMILEALYDDDEVQETGQQSSPTPASTSSPFMPSIHDKLALLAINNQQMDGSDSDSDDWSTDNDETKRDRKRSSLDANNQVESQVMNNKMDGSDANDWSSGDEEKEQRVSEETIGRFLPDVDNEQPFPTDLGMNDADANNQVESQAMNNKMDGSDADDLSSGDEEKEPRVSEETIGRFLTDADNEQPFPTDLGMNDADANNQVESQAMNNKMDGLDADDWSSGDDEKGPHVSEETRWRFLTDADSEQPFPTDLGINDSDADNEETRQVESESNDTSVPPTSLDTSRHSFMDAENEILVSDKKDERMNGTDADSWYSDGDASYNELLLPVVEDERMTDSDDDVQTPNQTEAQHTLESPVSEERSDRLSDANEFNNEPMNNSDSDAWHSDDDNDVTGQSQKGVQHTPESNTSEERSYRLSDANEFNNEPMNDSDSDAWHSDDDVQRQSPTESQHTPESATSEERSQRLSDANEFNNEPMNDSDSDAWHSDDDVQRQSQTTEEQHTPESRTSEERSQRLSDANEFKNEPMNDSESDAWHSDDDVQRQSKKEAKHSPESPNYEETNQRLSYANEFNNEPMNDSDSDAWHSDDDVQRQSQIEAQHAPESLTSEERSQQLLDANEFNYEPINESDSHAWHSDDDVQRGSQTEAQHTAGSLISEERSDRLSYANEFNNGPMDNSDSDAWHSDDDDVSGQSQKGVQHAQESPTSEERSQRLSDASEFNNEPMNDSESDAWHSDDDDVTGQSKKEAKHTPESPNYEETYQLLSYANEFNNEPINDSDSDVWHSDDDDVDGWFELRS